MIDVGSYSQAKSSPIRGGHGVLSLIALSTTRNTVSLGVSLEVINPVNAVGNQGGTLTPRGSKGATIAARREDKALKLDARKLPE